MVEADGVDRLYELEPGEFVAARDRLAKQLKDAGNREDSVAVKKLRRPSVVAWALNQVARTHAGEVAELLEAGAAVREAQSAMVAGGGPGELRDATRRRRQVVSTLARYAVEHAGSAHRDDVLTTLDAASLDADAAELLRRGRLTKELSPPSGFDLAGMPEPAPSSTPSPSHQRRADLERLRRELERAEQEVASAEDKVSQGEERLATAQTALERARRARDGAVEQRDRARAALAALEEEGE